MPSLSQVFLIKLRVGHPLAVPFPSPLLLFIFHFFFHSITLGQPSVVIEKEVQKGWEVSESLCCVTRGPFFKVS